MKVCKLTNWTQCSAWGAILRFSNDFFGSFFHPSFLFMFFEGVFVQAISFSLQEINPLGSIQIICDIQGGSKSVTFEVCMIFCFWK